MEIVFLLGMLVFMGGIGFLLFNLIKKRSKKKSLYIMLGSFIVMLVTVGFAPVTASLTIEAAEIETNKNGIALIEGTTNSDAKLTIDGKNLENDEGDFSYEVKLANQDEKKITLVAIIEDSEAEKVVTVTPSEEYITFLNEQKIEEEKLKKVETALVLAEKEPNQENYDKAATLVVALTKEYSNIDDQLTNVEDYLKAEEAVVLAEKELTTDSLEDAQTLIKKVTLNKENFSDRVKTIQTQVTEREEQLTLAKEAIDLAEETPTDNNYNHAVELIEALPTKDDSFSTRLVTVKTIIEKDKEEKALAVAAEEAKQQKIASEIAEKEKQANEQAAQAAQSTPAQSTPIIEASSQSNEQTVLVTPTGSKYHNRKCGNGTYTEASMSTALASGLTPCSKCY
ncbi:extracellular serine protease [Carnobacterium sp. 17-4]|uniref:serine protease n=1 Tax=Carnobacterium sp. (strain 17-4) TaxID=208596 RepID=UPI0002058FA8|nr:serine protease [Carnobacterium sp. 17-4]AEB30272.1 extracellular serine protease [Carnobacterium sp. 17-4]